MQIENYLYATAQLIHNFGAVAVTALPLIALIFSLDPVKLQAAYKLIIVAWVAQSVSGAGFGLISYFVVGSLPELHFFAFSSLILKITCAASAITLVGAKLLGLRTVLRDRSLLIILSTLGSTALASAAVLRWFS